MEKSLLNFDAINTDTIMNYITLYGMQVLAALAIFVIGRWLAKLLTRLARSALKRSKVDETLVSFIGNIVYALLLTFTVIAVLEQLGIDTTSFAAVIAAAGLAIGLALQGSLSNFAAGVMIIALRPFRIGDYIEGAGTAGSVADINILTTTLKTPDNKIITIPNSALTSDNITNYSTQETGVLIWYLAVAMVMISKRSKQSCKIS